MSDPTLFDAIPDGPGAHHRDDPSHAHDKVRRGTQRTKVLAAIAQAGDTGLTYEECDDITGLPTPTSARRIPELRKVNLVTIVCTEEAPSGVTRPTRSGGDGWVYVATAQGRQALAAL